MRRTINFMGVRHIAFAITLILTVASIASIAVKGFNFGLDFTGGTLIELSYTEAAAVSEVRDVLHSNGYVDAVVQSFGSVNDLLIRTPGEDPNLGIQIEQLLRQS